ncbi:hypothetical protein ILYODFUR_025435 [Ilyodon furcidens]|uniref:Clr5 domain-containing protein n=1 Tax=Ilyodon furcidens TaxID=33524 RepID=A0ABV0V9G0_9TELE
MASDLVEKYIRDGFTTNEILDLLENSHGFKVSKRTIERILCKKHLWQCKNKTDVAEVATFIEQQLGTLGQYHDYRWMHQKCWGNGIVTDREAVRLLLRILDDEGVNLRARNRLRRHVYHNYAWHIDGYDKIKPFGIAISGCYG